MSDSLLEIAIFTTGGSVHRYRQDDPALAKLTLSRAEPTRIFAKESLVVGGTHHVSAFRTKSILRVEFRGANLPQWGFGARIDDLEAVDRALFDSETAGWKTVDRRQQKPIPGESTTAHLVIEDSDGGRLYVRAHGEVLPQAVRASRLSSTFEAPALHIRRGDDTRVLVNPQNLAVVAVMPGAPELPSAALEANWTESEPE